MKYDHHRPSIKSPCNLKTRDNTFTTSTNMRGKNASHDLGSFFMSPDSTDISPNMNHIEINREEDSPAKSKIENLPQSLNYCGYRTLKLSHGRNVKQVTCSESTSKNFNSNNERVISKTHIKLERMKNSSTLQRSELVPQFCIVKKIENFNSPESGSGPSSRDHVPRLEDDRFNCLPSFDETTALDSEVAPLKFPEVAEKVMKVFSSGATPMQNVQQSTTNFRHQQPTSSQHVQKDYGKNSSPDKFSRWANNPFNVQQ